MASGRYGPCLSSAIDQPNYHNDIPFPLGPSGGTGMMDGLCILIGLSVGYWRLAKGRMVSQANNPINSFH